MGVMVGHPSTYFGQWIPHRSDLLIGLESEAEQQDIPILGPVVGKLLYLLAKIKGARRIVELGTATGYSAIGAIAIEFSRLPSMLGLLKKFARAAVLTDKTWLKW